MIETLAPNGKLVCNGTYSYTHKDTLGRVRIDTLNIDLEE